MKRNQSPFLCYGISLLIISLAVLARMVLDPYLHERLFFPTFLAAVATTAWLYGWKPALFNAVLAVIGAKWFFISPRYTMQIDHSEDIIAASLYFIGSLVIIIFIHLLQRERDIAVRQQRDLEREIGERGKAEDALRRKDELLSRAQAIANLGSWEIDLAKNRISWSEEVYRIFGVQPGDLGSTPEEMLDYVHPDDRLAVRSAYLSSLKAGGKGYESEHRIVRKSTGEVRVVHEKCEHFRDEYGRVVRSIGMVHDITERKEIEDKLRNSEEKARNILRYAPTGICEVAFTPGGPKFITVNDIMCKFLGYSESELLASKPLDLLNERGIVITQERIRNELAGEEKSGFTEYKVKAKDGREYDVAVRTKFTMKEGKLETALISGLDVTERKRAEEEIRRHADDLRYISDTATQMLVQSNRSALAQLMTERIYSIVGGAIVLFSEFDFQNRRVVLTQYRCTPDEREKAREVLGRDPEGMVFQFPEDLRARIIPGKLALLKDGVYELAFGQLAAPLCKAIEDKLGIADVYAMACSFEEDILGTVAVMTHRPGTFRNKELVETIVNQAALVLKRLRVEEALRESEERLGLAMLGGGVGAWETDLDNGDNIWNKGMPELLGVSSEQAEVESRRWTEYLHPEDRGRILAAFRAVSEEGKPWNADFRVLRADGSIRWVNSRGTIITSHGRRKMIGVDQDITERKGWEDALRKSEERLRVALDASKMGTWDWNLEAGEVVWNDWNYLILGYRPGEVKASYEASARRVHPDELASIEARWRQKVEEGGEYYSENRVIWSDGTVHWVEARGRFEKNASGKTIRSYGVVLDITERKRAEEALRESEEEYRQLFASMTEGFALHEIICDVDGKPSDFRFLKLNDAWERLTGISREEALGKTMKQVMPDIDSYWIETYGRVALTGDPVQYDNYNTPLQRWFETYAFSPKKNQFALVFSDITERKRAEEALQKSEERFRLFMDKSPTIAWIKDEEGRYVYLSQTYQDGLHVRLEDRIGKSDFEFRAKEIATRFRKSDVILLETGGSLESTEEVVDKDGSLRYWLISKFPFQDAASRRYVAGIGLDITERKRMEEELQKTREEYRHLVEASGSVILRVDKDMHITFINQFGLQFFGYSLDEIIGKKALGTIVPERDQEGHDTAAMAQDIIRNPENYAANFHQNMCKDGRLVWMSWANKPIYDDQGDLLEILSVGNDFSKVKEAEEELRRSHHDLEKRVQERTAQLTESEKRLRELAADLIHAQETERKRIAHELHDSLAAQLAAIKYRLERKRSEFPENPMLFDEIIEDVQNANMETRRIMANLRPSVLDDLGILPALSSFCRDTQKVFPWATLEFSGRVEESKVPDDLKIVLFRVVQESVTNAIRHGKSTLIRIGLERNEGWIRLSVRDNGKGFVAAGIERKSETHGIGLNSMEHRISSTGGIFSISSSPGRGTTVKAEWRLP